MYERVRTIIEVKAESLQNSPALRSVLEGTETESRLVHSEEIVISKDDFTVFKMGDEEHQFFLENSDGGEYNENILNEFGENASKTSEQLRLQRS